MGCVPNKSGIGRRTFVSELRVLFAVARKDWLDFTRYPTWVLVITVFPLMFMARYVYLGKMFAGPGNKSTKVFESFAGTNDYVGFLVLSGCMFWWLMHVMWGMGYVIREEQLEGTLEQNWVTPVSKFSLLLGSAIFHSTFGLLVMALILGLGHFLFGFSIHGDPFLVGTLFILTLLSLYGIGFIFAGLVMLFKEPHALTEAASSALMILCGIVYPVWVLPHWVVRISKLIPLTFAVEDLRRIALAGSPPEGIVSHLQVLFASALLVPALGYLAFRVLEKMARQKGLVGHY